MVGSQIIIDYQQETFKEADFEPNIENGEYVFNASGCSGCHMSLGGQDRRELGGGKSFRTTFGVFFATNISMSTRYGIGSWSLNDFNNAVRNGLSPKGDHYFPSFPFTSYSRMKDKDLVDLWYYWQTLPAVEFSNTTHDLDFPFSIRQAMWFWKKAFFRNNWVFKETDPRGIYLVESLAHCAECHTPRNKLGGLITSSWMRGGVNPEGGGLIPDIVDTTKDWSLKDIEEYLLSGFTPDFDTAGGSMVEVIESTKLLTAEDRNAIAKYIKGLSKQID